MLILSRDRRSILVRDTYHLSFIARQWFSYIPHLSLTFHPSHPNTEKSQYYPSYYACIPDIVTTYPPHHPAPIRENSQEHLHNFPNRPAFGVL